MSAVILYLASAILLTTTLAEETQWSPYNTYQPSQHQDQQLQASHLGGGYDFSNYGGSLGTHGSSSLDGHGDASFNVHDGASYSGNAQFAGHDFGGGHGLDAQVKHVHQHVEEENPEPIKHYKEIVVPIHKNVEFKINQPIIIPVPHPVPIHVPVPKAVVIPIIKEVTIPVEKSVPYPVERIVHVPKYKNVPFHVVKHILVPVEKPIPFKVPVYETVIHTKKSSHKV